MTSLPPGIALCKNLDSTVTSLPLTALHAAFHYSFAAGRALSPSHRISSSPFCRSRRRRHTHIRTFRCAAGNLPALPTARESDDKASLQSRTDIADLFQFAIPSYISQITEPAAALVDLFWVGRQGALPLAGTAVGSALFNTFAYVFSSLSYCANARIAAQKTRAGIERAAAASTLVALYLGIFVALILFTFAPVLTQLMGARADTASYAVHYLRARALGLPALLTYFALSGVFRGLRDLRHPLYASVLGALLNMVLDPAFMSGYPLSLGVTGAGIATSIAALSMTVYLVFALARKRVLRFPRGFRGGRVRREDARAVLSPLIPLSAKRILESAALAMGCASAARIGPESAAAMEIAQQCWWSVGVLWWPLGVAASAVIAGVVARGEKDANQRVVAVADVTVKIVGALGLLGGLVVFAASGLVPTIFVQETQFRTEASKAVRYLAIMLPVSAIVDAIDAVLMAVGDGRFVFVASAIGVGVCLGVIALLPACVETIWIALGGMMVLQAVAVGWRYRLFVRASGRGEAGGRYSVGGFGDTR